MRDIFFFDNMITPRVITLVYWLLLAAAAISGIATWFVGFGGFTFGRFLAGIAIFVGGVIGARIWCELLIVLFKMNEALQEIRRKP
mgnify:CR=1 FL=1